MMFAVIKNGVVIKMIRREPGQAYGGGGLMPPDERIVQVGGSSRYCGGPQVDVGWQYEIYRFLAPTAE